MLIAPSGNPCPSCVVDPGSMVDYRYWSPRIDHQARIHRDKRGDLPVRSESTGMTGGVAGLADGAAGAPVDAVGGAGEEVLVDQVAAQGAVVVEDGLEDLVHHRLGVAAAGLEGLSQLIEQHPPTGTLGRHGGDSAVPDERPQRGRRVGEQTVRVAVHHQPSMTRRATPGGDGDVPGGTVSRVARYDDDLRFAHVLADAADDITTRRFKALDLRVETKPDLTPVSDADRAAEESLRNVLRRARPRDAVLGEEFGRTGVGPRCWVIDPIDGTKNYVRGVPVW